MPHAVVLWPRKIGHSTQLKGFCSLRLKRKCIVREFSAKYDNNGRPCPCPNKARWHMARFVGPDQHANTRRLSGLILSRLSLKVVVVEAVWKGTRCTRVTVTKVYSKPAREWRKKDTTNNTKDFLMWRLYGARHDNGIGPSKIKKRNLAMGHESNSQN